MQAGNSFRLHHFLMSFSHRSLSAHLSRHRGASLAVALAVLAAARPAHAATLVDTTQEEFEGGTPTNLDTSTSPGGVTLQGGAVVDQQNTTVTNSGFGFNSTSWGGQTFTPSVSGQVTQVDIYLFSSGVTGTTPNITVSLRATTGSPAVPAGADLATASIPGFNNGFGGYYTATFATPATVTSGTQYAIIFRAVSNPSSGTYAYVGSFASPNSNPYAGGSRVTSSNSGSTWNADVTVGGRDLGFKIYIDSGYVPSGDLISSVKDSNPGSANTTWTSLSWTASLPPSTTLAFQIAGSSSEAGLFNFVGPDGSGSTYFTTSGASLSLFDGNRYLRYRAYFSTSDNSATPTLSDVTTSYEVSAAPTVASPTSADVTTTTATLGGNVTSDGGATVTERGVVYAVTVINSDPQLGGTGVTNVVGTGTTGVFNTSVTGLTAGTAYSYAAYATNGVGTGYSSVGTFATDTPPAFVGTNTTLEVVQNSGANDITSLLLVSDADSSETLTWSQHSAPAHGLLAFTNATAASGGTDLAPGGSITYTPSAGYAGSDAFTVEVGDGIATATRTISVTVSDVTAPQLSSAGLPANGAYATGQALDFTVSWSEPVLVSSVGGTPSIAISLDTGGSVQALYLSGSGSATLTFRYTVVSGNADADGIAVASSITLGGGTIRDAAGNHAAITGLGFASTAAVLVDTTAPTITSGGTASGTYKSVFGSYTVTANESGVVFGATGLPAGLSISSSTGAITGTPTQSGTFNVTLGATDAAGNSGTASLTLTVARAALTVTGITAENKVYDTTSAATLVTAGANLVGVAGGDIVTLDASAAAGAFSDANAGAGKIVSISGLALAGSNAAEYVLTQPATTADITKATTTITLGSLAQIYDGSAKNASATTMPAGLAVEFAYDGGATAPTNAGNYSVVGTIRDTNYQGSASGTLVIGEANQIVTFAPVGAVAVGMPVTLSATASSGMAVTFSVETGNATIEADTLTVHAGGTVTVRATQAGDANINPATASQTVDSNSKLPQTIGFAQPDDKRISDTPFTLAATASSGLPVSFAIVSGPAAVDGATLTLTSAPGTVTVVASQAGDSVHAAAPDVARTFAVIAPAPLTYFGTVASGAESRGDFAAHLSADGSAGTMIGYLPGLGGFLVAFTPDANGAFTVTITPIVSSEQSVQQLPATVYSAKAHGAALSAETFPAITAAATWTFYGQIDGSGITGTIDELGLGFAATVDPVSGPTSSLAGYYLSASLDTTEGELYAIVGTTGLVYALAVLPDLVDGTAGVLDAASGDFTVRTVAGAVFNGNIDAPTGTVDGAILRSGGSITEFQGVRAGTVRSDRLVNVSSRSRVGAGEHILITGFAVGGSQPSQLLLRAVGPGLADLGISDTIANPRVRLYRNGLQLAENDDWSVAANADDVPGAIQRAGAFGLADQSRDAALLVTLEPGNYTAVVDDANGEGIALAEIYDAGDGSEGGYKRLVNISTRGHVGPGRDSLIGGFVVAGNAPKRLLIRGVGPGLTRFGVTEAVANPRLRLFEGQCMLAENDDWDSDEAFTAQLAAAAEAAGAFRLDSGSRDSALLITLAPGIYTATVTTEDDVPGVVLFEAYEVPGQP